MEQQQATDLENMSEEEAAKILAGKTDCTVSKREITVICRCECCVLWSKFSIINRRYVARNEN